MTKAKPTSVATAKDEPNDRDRAAISHAANRVLARRKRIASTVSIKGAVLQVGSPHSDTLGYDAQLLDAFGTTSIDFANVTLTQLANAISDRNETPNAGAVNAAMAIVAALRRRVRSRRCWLRKWPRRMGWR